MDHPFLGPRIRRSRAFMGPWHALMHLAVGPIIISVSAVAGIWRDQLSLVAMGTAGGILYGVIAVAHLLWSRSAYLDLHQHGLVVGRRFGSRVREMWYSEIHPASIRVWKDIDAIRSLPRRGISWHWHICGGADLAVSFVGPARDTAVPRPTDAPRPPAPGEGRGLVIFGAQDAPLIADAIRDGLVRGGCPPHLAHWSAQFGVQVAGMGLIGQAAIPGMSPTWEP